MADPTKVFKKYDFPLAKKPVKPTKCESIKRCFYDSDDGTYLGRTPKNWCQLLLFYTIFFSVIVVMFAICMEALFATLSEDKPKWQLGESLIGTNPGLGFRPMSRQIEEGSLMWYDSKDEPQIKRWTDLLDEFLDPYHKSHQTAGTNQMTCNYTTPPGSDNVCTLDVANWIHCNKEMGYGYNKSAPCFVLKLNKIFSWVPEFYDNVTDLPEDMPKELVDYIQKQDPKMLKQVWVSCGGENPADREVIGPISYDPGMGFPGYFFPFTNQDRYLSPLVAVQLQRPQRHRLINIECRAWAKNIVYRGGAMHRMGSVHFELMID